MNLIFPAIAIIDRRDVPSAKRENIAKFIHIAQVTLFTTPLRKSHLPRNRL